MTVLLALGLLFHQGRTAEQLIEELRSGDIETRARAREQLKKLGTSAVPALEKLTNDPDADVAGSSREILKAIGEAKALSAAREMVKLGKEKHERRIFDAAAADFTKAIEMAPKCVDAYLARGANLRSQGDVTRAIEDFTRAIELKQKSAPAYRMRGDALVFVGAFNMGIADYTRALEIDPKDSDVYRARGLARQNSGDFDGAIDDCTERLKINPKDAEAYSSRSLSRHGKGDYDGAVEDSTRALELDPKFAPAYENRGLSRVHSGDYDGAIADSARLLDLDPKSAQAYYCRGLAMHCRGDLDGAIAGFSQAIERNPNHAPAYSSRGSARKAKGDLEGALADCTRAIKIDPRDGRSHFHRATLYYDLRAWPEALADFRQALNNAYSPTDYSQMRIFMMEARQGEGEAAKAALAEYRQERVRQHSPEWQGKILAFLAGESENEFLKSVPKDSRPKQCEAFFYAGTMRLIAGDRARAEDLLKKSVETGQRYSFEYRSAQAELEALKRGK